MQARQREDDAQLTKMILRDHEEKFKLLRVLGDSIVSAPKYLVDENRSLKEENELLQARCVRNSELTRFVVLENIRLLGQLSCICCSFSNSNTNLLFYPNVNCYCCQVSIFL